MTYVDVFDVFRTTIELTERVSNLQLPCNGVLAAFSGNWYIKMGFTQEEPVSVPDSMFFFFVFFLRYDGDVDTSMSCAVMI